jgi:glycosyltransferase involved in cell wall biosynthesis
MNKKLEIKILAIGDLANSAVVLKKFVKKSNIHVINFRWDTASKLTDIKENVEFFDSLKIKDQLKKILEIKDNYDLVLVQDWSGARLAYLANLNYIIYFVGAALRVPPFIKNPKLEYLKDPLPSLNYFERRFYKKILDDAVACVANADDLFKQLKKFRTKEIHQIGIPIDTTMFNENIKSLERKKEKFTFLSPQRIGLAKGFDIIWEALKLCKSDFDVLQVEWFLGQRTKEEREINANLVKNMPSQVKLIPIIKKEEIPNYYAFADAVIGQMKNGLGASVEREAVYCKKPVVQYADPKIKFEVEGDYINSTFLPHSNNPKDVADVIDNIVLSKEFREKLIDEEYNFVKKVADPEMIAKKWDDLFQKINTKNKINHQNSSNIIVKLRLVNFLIINRLYFKKIKKIFEKLTRKKTE